MPKEKTQYQCRECGAVSSKWSGQCSACGEWNTLEEYTAIQIDKTTQSKLNHKINTSATPKKLSRPVKAVEGTSPRLCSGIGEFDRVLGGGFFPGSLTLLTGDPGIGKSTLSLMAALHLAKNLAGKSEKNKVVLVSGEESESQISDRLFRLQNECPENLFLLSDGIWESILPTLPLDEIGFLIFDSVQTIATTDIPSASGSMAQTVAITERIMGLAKERGIPTLLIGHVTKTGEMAGPQTLAHLVDTVLHLSGEDFSEYRILKSRKNRFGSVSEMGVFEMKENGLREVKNPSQSFLSGRLNNALGSAIFAGVEGTRPFLIEVQALTKYTSFGYPKRSTSGFDANRLAILIAVLLRFGGIKLDSEDVFVNTVGGLVIKERACDLAVIAALVSSKKKIPLSSDTIFLGEVGLSGEVRNVAHLEKRLQEAERMGFKKAVVPTGSSTSVCEASGLEVQKIGTVGDLQVSV